MRYILVDADRRASEVKRLCKGKDRVPTLRVIVSFKPSIMPDSFKVYHQRFGVRSYVDLPWQCYRRQHFGHNAEQCRYKPRCVVCFGPHVLRDCPNQGSNVVAPDTVRCDNCKGNHTANYGAVLL